MLKSGETFERYVIEAPLGQGGMGCVYRAHDARLGRRVALKVLSEGASSAEANERLLREARSAAALDHPNVVAIFDVGERGGEPYIVMELVSGHTLRKSIEEPREPAATATRITWLTDVARALAAAHRRGLVHRDIKPENVMVRDDGVVKVLDFGIARRARAGVDPAAVTELPANETPALPTLTIEGVKLGTPVYMAPEQIRGQALDGRVDQFAWGVLAFELLTGRLPWRGAGDVFAVVASILTDQVDGAALDAASVPPEVRDVVLRVLAKRPDDRFASMDEVVRALEAFARGEAAPSPRFSPPERPVEPERSGTLAQRYSTQEVRDVLARAIEQQAAKSGDSKLGFDDLLAAAREVGVDTETLREASRGLRREEERPGAGLVGDRDAWIRIRRRQFYRHAGVYLIVHAALLMGLLLVAPAFLPYLGVHALLWGMGLAIHGMIALTSNEDDWKQEKEGMKWWLEQRQRRHERALGRAVETRASPRHERGRGPRQRIEPQPERPRVRVAEETDGDAVAEEEAAVAEDREVKRRGR
jgi:eukaryotic-like serine/threonine-protein kinase